MPAADLPPQKKICLALQGGGAHGAFTWGILDHLLEDGRLSIEGISGTSAGAINAVMLGDGLARGGPPEARKRLAQFWRAISTNGDLPPVQRRTIERLFSFVPLKDSPLGAFVDAMSRSFSPYDFNPLNINPLNEVIERFVDFEAVRSYIPLHLYVCATNVKTGRLRIFSRENITANAVMASACLPNLFQAVMIDGVPYWDGGYLGNPAIFPLFRNASTEDVLIVQINPIERDEVPTSSAAILNRIRNQFQFATVRRIPCDRVRRAADRSGTAATRHCTRTISPYQCAQDRSRGKRKRLCGRYQAQHRLRLLPYAARERPASGAKLP